MLKLASHPPTCLDILLARWPPPQLKDEVGQVGRPAEQGHPRRWPCVAGATTQAYGGWQGMEPLLGPSGVPPFH